MKNKQPSLQFWIEVAVLGLLVAVGVASRFLIDTPNFKPIAAFALFGGFFFRKPSVAIFGVILMMSISDFRIGFYPWQMMISVYLSLALSVGLGMVIRGRTRSLGKRAFLSFAGASLLMSTTFYLLTNAAVCWMGWYPMSVTGLLESYTAAIPFYRWTLVGDLFFTTVTVGSYALVQSVSRLIVVEKRFSYSACN